MKRSERLVKEGKNLHNDYTLYTPEITHQINLTPEVMTGYEGGEEGKIRKLRKTKGEGAKAERREGKQKKESNRGKTFYHSTYNPPPFLIMANYYNWRRSI